MTNTLNERLHQNRMSVSELARKTSLSRTTITDIIKGRKDCITFTTAQKLGNALNCFVAELFPDIKESPSRRPLTRTKGIELNPSSEHTSCPKWCKETPDLFNSVCRYADRLEDACNTCRHGEHIEEYQLSELRKSLYLARLDGYIEAIEAFTGVHYCFTRTDDYYGICDDNEEFIYKVPRCQK